MKVELAKALAYMQYAGEDYFVYNDVYYQGTLEDAKQDYEESEDYETFDDYVAAECLEVEEWDDSKEDDLVLTDDEADERVEERIKEDLWAFNASFIVSHCKVNTKDLEKAIKIVQEKLSEDANDLVEALIDDMDDFIADAISADGRGHFLASYDSEENEVEIDGQTFYIYKN